MSTEAIDEAMIHPTAIVGEGARIGAGTRIWHQSHVRAGAVIGEGCNIGFCVYVDQGVVVGDRCKIQNHVSVYEGVTIEDDVFVGPAATFTNDLHPRAHPNGWTITPTVVRSGASIGAKATIVCGVEIGAHAMVAAGAVVTADVPPHALVMGTPARVAGWVCVCGWTLARAGEVVPATCSHCGRPAEGVAA